MVQIRLTPAEEEIKQTILNVIEHGSVYNVEKLNELYADNMHIVRVGEDGKTVVLNKNDVLKFFESKRASLAEPLSKEAHFNHIETNESMAHVIVTRIMKMFGQTEKSIYSICLAKKESGWLITKETVISVAQYASIQA